MFVCTDIPDDDDLHKPNPQQFGEPVPIIPPDPFDPANLRMAQDFAAASGVKKALLTVPVKKPEKTWFVRVHPAPEYRLETGVLEIKEDREIYLVARELRGELATESTFGLRAIFLAVNRQGIPFLWPISLPGPDGKVLDWHASAMKAAMMAMTRWVRVQANLTLGAYEVWHATGNLPDPTWPDLPLGAILRIAFKDRYVDTLDHPVLKRLRGEI